MTGHPPPPSATSSSPLPPPRRFTLSDALAVYRLAQQPTRLGDKVKQALDITQSALDTYGVDHVALSFNGGKDCTVLVHLLAACLLRHHHPSLFSSPPSSSPSAPSSALPTIPTVYIRCPSPFPQVEAFVSLCIDWYALELEAVEGGMKEGLQGYLDAQREGKQGGVKREVEAVLVGVRRGDPHSATLTPLCPTDSSWPRFMRVHPILEWSYGDVWEFLRSSELTLGSTAGGDVGEEGSEGRGKGRGLEWCELYGYGYTSLGSTHNTFPNPLLRATTTDGHYSGSASPCGGTVEGGGEGENGKEEKKAPLGGWRPAWELEDESAERAGRETALSAVLARVSSSPPPNISTAAAFEST